MNGFGVNRGEWDHRFGAALGRARAELTEEAT